MCAIGIKFHQGGQPNRLTGGEIPGGQRFVEFDGVQDFLRLPSLTARKVGSFESPGIVFAFRPAALVRACDARAAFSKTLRLSVRLAMICFISSAFFISWLFTTTVRPSLH